MKNTIETQFINKLHKDERNLYLKFLVSNGNESYIFYKHSVKFSKKMFIYKVNEVMYEPNGIT